MLRLLLAVTFALAACAVVQAQSTEPEVAPYERVEATRYQTAGGATSSGEFYNPERLTMAHPSLPMGALVEVTFRRRTVTVRVNDRLSGGGEVRLSARAADQLGLPPGGAPVELRLDAGERAHVERLDARTRQERPARVVEAAPEGSGPYVVQIGAFSDESGARAQAGAITGARVQTRWAEGAPIYRVFYGRFEDSAAAAAARDRLRTQGIDGFVRRLTDEP